MIPVSATLADAIQAPERHPLVRLSVDWDTPVSDEPWDLSALVESVTIDRALAGDLPDDVSLVEGAAAATMDVTFGDGDVAEGIPASRYFNRLNPDSPLYGKELLSAPCTLDIGFQTAAGPEFVRRFTGLTRSFKSVSGARTARMTALDLRERLSWTRDLPRVSAEGRGLNASWALSSVLQSGEFLTKFVLTPPWDGAVSGLYVPFHGSLHLLGGVDPRYTTRVITSYTYPATITGTTSSDLDSDPIFQPGPYVSGCYAGPIAVGKFRRPVMRGELAYSTAPTYSDYISGRVEFWTKRRNTISGESGTPWKVTALFTEFSNTAGLMAGINGAGQLVIGYHLGNPDSPTAVTGPTVPDDGQWHYVGLEWDGRTGAGNYKLTFRLDGAAPTVTNVAGFPANAPPFAVTNPKFYWRQPVSELMYQGRPDMNGATWRWDTRDQVNVVLDYSSLELDVIPETGQRPVWEWLRRIAAAEQAVVHVDEAGILRYRTANRLSAPSAQTPVRVVTATQSLLGIGLDDSVDAVRNDINATVHPVTISDVVAPVFASTDVWSIPPFSTGHLAITLDKPAVEADLTVTLNRPADPAPNPATTYVCVAFNPDGTSTGDPTTESGYFALVTELSYWDERTYDLGIRNDYVRTVYIATTKADTPVVSVAGRSLQIGNVDMSSYLAWATGMHPAVRRHGEQPLKLSDNPWMQNPAVVEGMLQRLVFSLYRPTPVVRDLEIVGDPRLQLGDRIRIEDRDGLALNADYWISGIRETFSRTTGYRQTITARRADTTLRWGTGKWGENTWGEI